MGCNGCRVLRKGCNENCILRQSLQGIGTPQAQANATVFVAKFFGRAGLMSFLSAVPESQRPALFKSLLYEACGRTVNPVNGVVGLLWTGNWHLCQSAVETVLRGGHLRPMTEDLTGRAPPLDDRDDALIMDSTLDEKKEEEEEEEEEGSRHLRLNMAAGGRLKRRTVTPEESKTTTWMDSRFDYNNNYGNFPNVRGGGENTKLLRLFF